MRIIYLTAAAICALTGAARAESQSEVIFQRGAWDVQVVSFDDGSQSCVANVYQGGDSFSLSPTASGPRPSGGRQPLVAEHEEPH